MKIKTRALSSKAKFSEDGRFRYELHRKFTNAPVKWVNFIMLNPSTADENHNDPTVARCEAFAIKNGFDGLIVTNIFAFRATDPADMKAAHSQGVDVTGGISNDLFIKCNANLADLIICAWGNHATFLSRGSGVRKLLTSYYPKTHYLALNASGEPKHPLYVSGQVQPIKIKF